MTLGLDMPLAARCLIGLVAIHCMVPNWKDYRWRAGHSLKMCKPAQDMPSFMHLYHCRYPKIAQRSRNVTKARRTCPAQHGSFPVRAVGNLYSTSSSILAMPKCSNLLLRWQLIRTFGFSHVYYLLQLSPYIRRKDIELLAVAMRLIARRSLGLHSASNCTLTSAVSGIYPLAMRAAQLQSRLHSVPPWHDMVINMRTNGTPSSVAARTSYNSVLQEQLTSETRHKVTVIKALLHHTDPVARNLVRTISTPEVLRNLTL